MPSFSAKHNFKQRHVAFIVFEGTKLLDVAGPIQVFNDARLANGKSGYKVDIISEKGGQIPTDTICQISSISFQDCTSFKWDTVLICGGNAAYKAAKSKPLLEFIKKIAKPSRRLGSICLGVFILASTGHLTGRKATTHWNGCAKLAADFPNIDVIEDAIFIEDKTIWSSAGVTTGIDMALEMVKQDLGAAEALRIAKLLVVPIQRSGGQRQFSTALSAQTKNINTRFSSLIIKISANLNKKHTVTDMAHYTGMSDRNFSRLFTKELGISPAKFVEQLRVNYAVELLHNKNISLIEVQKGVGFTNGEQMRHAFHRYLNISPSEYVAKFTYSNK